MESRAAVFTSQPQDVEVYHRGAWLAGSMLGWRHGADGGCQAWVRLNADGDEPIWTGLEALRLPERHLAVAPEEASGAVVDLAGARPLRDPSSTGPATRVMPALREGVPTGRAAHPAGRRRAPDTGEVPVAPVAALAAGRHRAPSAAAAGRHRAADTGAMPAVTAIDATCEMPWARASAGGDARPGRRATATTPGLELLTRPMRLGDFLREPRDRRSAGRLDDTLTGV